MLDETTQDLVRVMDEASHACGSSNICLSGGLDSTIAAYHLRRTGLRATTIIARDFLAEDLTYCQMAADNLGIPLDIRMVSSSDIMDAVEETIGILGNFNDIEIRNSIVMYLAATALKESGVRRAITGDGADELFAGYDFLARKRGQDLEDELKRMRGIMHFPSQKIGRHVGVELVSPYLDERVIRMSEEIPASLKVDKRNGKSYGKWILRKAYRGAIPDAILWRAKSPMQDGAGTAALTDLFSALIPDQTFEERRESIRSADGVVLRTKESMHYYEIFRRRFARPSDLHTSKTACRMCGYATPPGARFCRMCGTYPL